MRVHIGCMSIEYLLHLKHGCQGERFIVLSVSFKANPFLADEEKMNEILGKKNDELKPNE